MTSTAPHRYVSVPGTVMVSMGNLQIGPTIAGVPFTSSSVPGSL